MYGRLLFKFKVKASNNDFQKDWNLGISFKENNIEIFSPIPGSLLNKFEYNEEIPLDNFNDTYELYKLLKNCHSLINNGSYWKEISDDIEERGYGFAVFDEETENQYEFWLESVVIVAPF